MYRLRKKTTFVKNKTFVLIFVDDRAYKGHMYIDCPRAGHSRRMTRTQVPLKL